MFHFYTNHTMDWNASASDIVRPEESRACTVLCFEEEFTREMCMVWLLLLGFWLVMVADGALFGFGHCLWKDD